MNHPRAFIGLASGSGGEGTDAVLVETTGIGLHLNARVVHHHRRPHSPPLRELLSRAIHSPRTLSIPDCAQLNRLLCENEVDAARHLITGARVESSRVGTIGRLGPLLVHDANERGAATFEPGLPALLAEATGLTVVSEFRERDLAAGGQGMPIGALADWALFRHPTERRVLLHLGSVTSIVILRPSARPQDLVAFESGPGTRLIDAVVRQGSRGKSSFDVGGKHAVQGRCLETALTKWFEHPYFAKPAPKSLPRTEFGAEWIEKAARAIAESNGSFEDMLCTLSHLIIRSALNALRSVFDGIGDLDIWLSGGGSRNGFFWRLLEQESGGSPLHRLDELGVPTQARQAAEAAVLAAFTMDGVPAGSVGTTGVGGRLLGRLTPGEPRNWARCLNWMADKIFVEPMRPYKAA